MSMTALRQLNLYIRKSEVSSANWDNKLIISLILMPSICLFSLILSANIWPQRRYNRGATEQPWCRPRVDGNQLDMYPLFCSQID